MRDTSQLTPTPPPRVGRLDSIMAIRRELARVYKDARQGRLATADASRLGFLLGLLAKIIEGSALEQRLGALEMLLKGPSHEK